MTGYEISVMFSRGYPGLALFMFVFVALVVVVAMHIRIRDLEDDDV